MILHDLDVVRAVLTPLEAHPPSSIDPNAELAPTIASEGLEAVAGQGPQGFKGIGGVEQTEPLLGLPCEALKLANRLAIEKALSTAILVAPNHESL